MLAYARSFAACIHLYRHLTSTDIVKPQNLNSDFSKYLVFRNKSRHNKFREYNLSIN